MYIPIWLIVIAVIIYFFWARKKKTAGGASIKSDSKFVGRYQQICITKKFLGEEVPELEIQIAENKDNSERDEIVEKLKKVEEYIKSDMFTNHLDVESVNKDMRELMGEGYQNCVLKNDIDLENRCYKIFDDTHKYLEKHLQNRGENAKEFANLADKIRSLFYVEGIVNYIRLGGLLKDSSDEQKVWVILNSLKYKNELVKMASSLLPPEPSEKEAEKLKIFAERLLRENKISNSDLQKINSEIKDGLIQGKENYKSA